MGLPASFAARSLSRVPLMGPCPIGEGRPASLAKCPAETSSASEMVCRQGIETTGEDQVGALKTASGVVAGARFAASDRATAATHPVPARRLDSGLWSRV